MMSPRARALDFWPIGPSGRRFGDDAGKEAQLKVLVERLTGEAGGDDAGEVGAFEDVFVRAAQRVIDGLAGGLGLGDLLVELVELAPSEPLPGVERDGA